jgi:hypothetical protein
MPASAPMVTIWTTKGPLILGKALESPKETARPWLQRGERFICSGLGSLDFGHSTPTMTSLALMTA